MKAKIGRTKFFGRYSRGFVWINKWTDNMRAKQCLCSNCVLTQGCGTAMLINSVVVTRSIAVMVTQCPTFTQKG